MGLEGELLSGDEMSESAADSRIVTHASRPGAGCKSRLAAPSLQASLVFLLLHVPLALLMHRYRIVGHAHTLACLAVGIAWAVSKQSSDRVPYILAYIAGVEALWRMTDALFFWEFGKYAVILVCFLAIQRKPPINRTRFPFVFLALLIPSSLLTMANCGYDFESFRKPLSANLSGPVCLAFCVALFSCVRLTGPQLYRLLVAYLGPVVGVASLCVFSIRTAENLVFTKEANFTTSGGFGPNQVSSVLGCGALFAILLGVLILSPRGRSSKGVFIGLGVWLATQTALTFSRSGVYMAVGSAAAAATLALRSARMRGTLLVTLGSLFLIGELVVLPQLDEFTGGKFSERFSDPDLSERDRIMDADLKIWMSSPVFGVGPGSAPALRAEYFKECAAHTEVTRLVAEHGLLGVAALGMLLASGWESVRRTRSIRSKAFVTSMIVFAILYMLSNATRLTLPAFTFGLAFATHQNE